MSLDSLPTQNLAKFRADRFIEKDPDRFSLVRIGEYKQTPVYEPSLRAMCMSLSDVLAEVNFDQNHNKKFKAAWAAANKIFTMRSQLFKAKFREPFEYCIALICFTLDEPHNIYQEVRKLCQDLLTDSWCDFPYKGLFYLLVQAEMRMRLASEVNEEVALVRKMKTMRLPITITSGLDYSIEEIDENDDSLIEDPVSTSLTVRKIHSTSPLKKNTVHRAYLGLEFPLSETEFKPRTLVSFNHILPTTLDEPRLIRLLEEKNKKVTLLEIDQISWSAKLISSLSVYPSEKEVLVWPWIKFFVEKRVMIRKNIEKIVLKPTSKSHASTGPAGDDD